MASGPPSPETVCGCCDVYVCVSSGDNFRSFVNIKMGLIKGQKKKLISKRDSLKKKIEEIKKTERVISDAVLEWLDEVEKVIQEEENLKKETLTHGHICFCFPGTTVKIPKSNRERRLISWNYSQIEKEMRKLNAKRKFEPISSPSSGLEHYASGNFVCFKSTKEASDQLLGALHDDSSYIIGLYGKQGSGKTTLVKAMGEKAKHLRIFGVVLFVTVSQNPNIRRIQDEIAESLNLRFDKNSEAGRARTIHSTLESMGGVLVILDDVRAKVELEDIGIPSFSRNANQSKVLLTTRGAQECALMECRRKILLGPLSKEEAWTLFKKHSGIDDDEPSSSLLNVAHEVANECRGLPGAIEDVGCSLKSKPIEEWKALLDSLKHSTARYQIFLSFRGEDTRHSFTGSLYHALCEQGFKTFMDDGELQGGDQISASLLKAIEESRLSIIILSENYAYSSWCLDELVKILECMKMNNQLVWPIFYKVEPSDIRHLRNGYGEAIAKHEKRYGNNSRRVQKWKSALSEISNLSGKPYKTGYEYEYRFIQKIVEDANNIKSRLYIRSTDMD